MHERKLCAAVLFGVLSGFSGQGVLIAQDPHAGMVMGDSAGSMAGHGLWQANLGRGWTAAGSGQLFPILTIGAPTLDASPLNDTQALLTQPAIMARLQAPGQRLTLGATINFEGVTQEDGELGFGSWGEGFIDTRHPHTLLHELILSVNFWEFGGGAFSLSAGKGFAPFGTDDPMSRPGLKYPTNHHLSQILERWMVGGAYLRGGWGVEAGAFGGGEPEDPYDFSNINSFANSWSARVSRRWAGLSATPAQWEVSASHARVVEPRDGEDLSSRLWNVALRREASADSVTTYAMVEASLTESPGGDDFFSVLAEGRLDRSSHQPYARVEYASRPEYSREGGGAEFFRYEHEAEPIGSTLWLIGTIAYAYEMTAAPISFRPFLEVQRFQVWEGRGDIAPAALFGRSSFWSLTLGGRIFLWGGPMRMGAYGVLDSMTAMTRGG